MTGHWPFELEVRMSELGLTYGPCWVTLLAEDGMELPVVRKVARLVECVPERATWSAVHFIAPALMAFGAARRRKRVVLAAAAGSPCGKASRLGSIEVRPDELVTVVPRVSLDL